MSQVAVIGAGLSGLTAARGLRRAGYEVSVFDKARGPGGRTSTRRTEPGLRFDHGAQYFTVKDERFEEQVQTWSEAGIVQPWSARFGVRESGALSPKEGGPTRWVGVPGMNAMAKAMAQDTQPRYESTVEAVERGSDGWRLKLRNAEPEGPFERLVVSLPPRQAGLLLAEFDAPRRLTEQVAMKPCWTVMLGFVRPLDVPYDGIFVNEGPLSWLARNSSKPGRNETETWVLHGGPEWSQAHLELAPHEAETELTQAFFEAVSLAPVQNTFHAAHRWRFSAPDPGLDRGCWWDPELGLGLVGDWLHGARVEGAYLSGLTLANAMTEQ